MMTKFDNTWFNSINELVDATKESGNKFFSEATLRWFDSEIDTELFGGRVFVTREQAPHWNAPAYTVRVIEKRNEDARYSFEPVSGLGAYENLEDARQAAKHVAQWDLPNYFEPGDSAHVASLAQVRTKDHA